MDEDVSDICLNLFTPSSEVESPKKDKKKRRHNETYSSTAIVQNSDKRSLGQVRSAKKTNVRHKVQASKFTSDGIYSKAVSEQNETEVQHTDSSGRTVITFGNRPKKRMQLKGNKGKQSEEKIGDSKAKHSHRTHSGKISSLFGNNPEIPAFARRVVNPVLEPVFSTKQFKDLPIHKYLVSNLEQHMDLHMMTTVQQKAIPVLLSGKDALVRSQTGSGKTLAYALPIVELLQRVRPELKRADGIQALVVVPTRELALQTFECFEKLVQPFKRLVPGYLVGGEKRKAEKARLRKGLTVLVGTPGRLLDHVQHTRNLRLDGTRFLVLDEADRLLDMGYERDIASLISALDSQDPTKPMLPWLRKEAKDNSNTEDKKSDEVDRTLMDNVEDDSDSYLKSNDESEKDVKKNDSLGFGPKFGITPRVERQTVLLSATLTAAVERLAGLMLRSPTFVDAADASVSQQQDSQSMVIPESLVQCYLVTPAKLRLVSLAAFILWKCQMSGQRKMILFCATQVMVDFHTQLLTEVLALSAADSSGSDEDEEMMGLQDGSSTRVHVEFYRLHGNMSQKERTEVFKKFRAAESGVLLCTDVAARGLDLPHVDWILQYTAPTSISDYVHRVGRTARVGSAGSALLFLTPTELQFLRMLEDHRIRLQEETMDRCLEKLLLSSSSSGRKGTPGSVEAAATALQSRFETAVLRQRGLHDLACKAYVSWARFYASLPKDMRTAFSFKTLHLGHHAKAFALRDPPSTIGGIGRRQWQDRPQRPKRPRAAPGSKPKQPKDRTRQLLVSEFASGLEPLKKKKKRQ